MSAALVRSALAGVWLAACAGMAQSAEPVSLALPRVAAWAPLAATARGEESAPAVHEGGRPVLVPAQRAIERSWGESDDSIYVEHDIPGWRSEGFAMAMSAVLPGAGQVYVGENARGLWFALAEAAGWVTRTMYRRRGESLRDDAAGFVGVPQDPSSGWSFERWRDATGGDASELEALWAGDRDAFYERIATDARYAAGWDGEERRGHVQALRDASDDRLRFARYAGIALWFNHVVAAVDALRAARAHNLPLAPKVSLEFETAWHDGRPAMVAALVRRF